jgi:hypothetical protein
VLFPVLGTCDLLASRREVRAGEATELHAGVLPLFSTLSGAAVARTL